MTATTFSTSADQTVKLWSDRLIYDTTSGQTLVADLIKDGSLVRQDDLSKNAGDEVKYDFLNRISSKGLIGNASATGNEVPLVYAQASLVINELRKPVQIPNKMTIDQQRVKFGLTEDTYTVLRNWIVERQTVSAFNALCGFNPTTFTYDGETFTGDERLELWGMNTPTAPTSTRVVRANSLGTDLLVNGDTTATMKLSLIDEAEKIAAKSRPYITPLNEGEGEIKFRCYVHVDQFYQLIQDTSGPIQYRDILLNQIAAKGKDAMIGRRFVYSQTEIICTDKIPNGVTSNSVNANTRRALFVGKHAGAIAFGKGFSAGGATTAGFLFRQDMVDIEKWIRIAVSAIYGIKKTVFNSIDHGSIVITTYVA